MHSVNLDLLRAATARPDAAHAYHREEHLAALRATRRQRWQNRFARLLALFPHCSAPGPQACPDHQT
ncbi:MAG: hypothetical protein JNK19_04915 [Tabrizicola sp.]|nr:hypothetical protein [Tabrizicola sp.]